LIVGVLASPVENVRVRIRDVKGALFEGNREGCPEAPGIVCSYSFFTSPSDRSVTLLIEPAAGMGHPARAEIPLGGFNYCGRDIAYVVVTLVPGSGPRIAPPRLVSPCETEARLRRPRLFDPG